VKNRTPIVKKYLIIENKSNRRISIKRENNMPTCAICAGVGYVRSDLAPSHRLFGQPICCPKCGQQALLSALSKRWPVTAEQEAFGLTPFCDRAEEGDFPAVLLAWETAYHFLDGLPNSRLLALHGHAGCGKTHLLLILRHQALKKKLSSIYVTAPDLQKRVQQFDDNERRLRDWHDLTSVDLLLIDELDDLLGHKIQPRLLQLINVRTSAKRATAFAFNNASCLSRPIKSRLQAHQAWVPENRYIMPFGHRSTSAGGYRASFDKLSRDAATGWIDLTSVPDARPTYGSVARTVNNET